MSKLIFNPISGQFDTVVTNTDEVAYSPTTPADWTTVPSTTTEALDELAATLVPVQAELPYTIEQLSGDALEVNFTLTTPVISKDSLLVFIDGVYQEQDSYSYASPVITFTSAPPTGTDNIEVRHQTTNTIIEGIRPLTTKGDLVVHDGVSDVRLPVGGADGQTLSVSSGTSTGLEWKDQNFFVRGTTTQTFTSDGLYTLPVGCKSIIVELQGGGGGGAGLNGIYNSYLYIAPVGRPGQYAKILIETPDPTYNVVIGQGGAAAISGTNSADSVAGGVTSFGAFYVSGGVSVNNSGGYTNWIPTAGQAYVSKPTITSNNVYPGLASAKVIETYHISNDYDGSVFAQASPNMVIQSNGPATKFGKGGIGALSSTSYSANGSQAPATSYGAGGGNASAGRPGIVIVHEYY